MPLPSSSITQSALPAVSALVASNKNFFTVVPTGLMVKLTVPDVPPPGAGVNIVIATVPAVVTSEALIDAVNCVLLTKVVVNVVPFHLITELLRKLLPLAVNVKVAAPAVTLVGEIETRLGTGLLPTGDIVKLNGAVVPPPGVGVLTVTGTVPAVLTWAALTEAVNCKPLTKVVGNAVPFQLITELLIKFVPFTVRVNAADPAVTLAGDNELIVGRGFVAIVPIVNTSVLELPPPGVPLTTVILALPGFATKTSVIFAVNCVALIYVVDNAVPFQFIVEPVIKLVPVIVIVKDGSPAVTLEGEIAAIAGTGFGVTPPPGLTVSDFLQARKEIVASKMVIVSAFKIRISNQVRLTIASNVNI